MNSYNNHYHTLFIGTKLKLLPFNKQVETYLFCIELINYDTFLTKSNFFLKLSLNYDGDNDVISKGSDGIL